MCQSLLGIVQINAVNRFVLNPIRLHRGGGGAFLCCRELLPACIGDVPDSDSRYLAETGIFGIPDIDAGTLKLHVSKMS